MAFPILAAAIGAALGAAKFADSKSKANSERKSQSKIQRYSPWTGMTGDTVKGPSLIGELSKGAAVGSMFGQGAPGMIPGLGGGQAQGALQAQGQASAGIPAPPGPSFNMSNAFRQGVQGGGQAQAPNMAPWTAMMQAMQKQQQPQQPQQPQRPQAGFAPSLYNSAPRRT